MSGAALADLVNEAAIIAARAKRATITQADLVEGQLRAIAGPEKNRVMSEVERELIAYHESGHVLCAELSAEHEKAQRAPRSSRAARPAGSRCTARPTWRSTRRTRTPGGRG